MNEMFYRKDSYVLRTGHYKKNGRLFVCFTIFAGFARFVGFLALRFVVESTLTSELPLLRISRFFETFRKCTQSVHFVKPKN